MSNKKWLRRRTVVIQSALDSPDLGEHFRYLERHDKCCRKISTDTGSWKPPQKTAKREENPAQIHSRFRVRKAKITYFHISVCVLCLVCRMDMIQCALDSPHLVECFRYPHWYNMMRKKPLEPFKVTKLCQKQATGTLTVKTSKIKFGGRKSKFHFLHIFVRNFCLMCRVAKI